jgi:hypothetical protein
VLTVGSEAGHTIATVLAVSPHGHEVPRHVYVTDCEAIAGGVPASGIGPSGVPASGVAESGCPASGMPALAVPAESGDVTPDGDPHAVSAATHEIQRRTDLGLQL